MPALPFSPVKFSALMERDSTLSRRKIFSRLTLMVAPPWSCARKEEGRTIKMAAKMKERSIIFFIILVRFTSEGRIVALREAACQSAFVRDVFQVNRGIMGPM